MDRVWRRDKSDFYEYLGTELRTVVEVSPSSKLAPSERTLKINGQFTKILRKVPKARRRASDQTVE